MIVFNLSCVHGHEFDGWFRSAEDFDRQNHRVMVECPHCGDTHITKRLSAPRLNMGATDMVPALPRVSGPQEVMPASMMPGLQEHMLQQFKAFVRANTENVGGQFAETARRMHYGEESHRNIRGRVSQDEAVALSEEGIETVSLPHGILLDEGVQ